MKSFLRNSLRRLTNAYRNDELNGEDIEMMASSLCKQASLKASHLGLVPLVRQFTGHLSYHDARLYLTECLAACETKPDAEFLTIGQVVVMIGLSEKTIRRRVADGVLPPPIKIGHATRWRRLDIENYRGSYR
jgi:predicted DNA-binding transcriptional regulator AlpA